MAAFLAATQALTLHLLGFGKGSGQYTHSSNFSIGHGTTPQLHTPPLHNSQAAARVAAASAALLFPSTRALRTASSRSSSASLTFFYRLALLTPSSHTPRSEADPPTEIVTRACERARFLTVICLGSGALVVGAAVVGAAMVGAAVVGASAVGAAAVGASVVDTPVVTPLLCERSYRQRRRSVCTHAWGVGGSGGG